MANQTLTALSTTDILEKDFRTELRGYSITEVDAFLDEVIADYLKLYKEVARLNDEIVTLKESGIKASVRTVEGMDTTVTNATSNYDVLKRVSHLEKQVVGLEKSVATITEHLKKRAEQERLRREMANTKATGTVSENVETSNADVNVIEEIVDSEN
jgi:DivIVA domain